VVCYADRDTAGAYAERFRATTDLWRLTDGLSTAQFVELVRSDQIDCLVDLMGHAGRRLPVFAQRPVPLQVTWFGYVGTTGLAAIDCLLADRFHVSPDEESNYVESVICLPHGYACYGPPGDAPDVANLPGASAGHVTFGCFNNPRKFSPRILDAWAEILRRVPTALLLLKFGGLDQADMQKELQARFRQGGIDNPRIAFEGWSPHQELLTAYNRVDLALDTQPYSGGVTTCEALWMGAPVITWPGRTFAGRHAVSHLTNAGYPKFVAANREGYVELAVEWANRLEELAAIRRAMREQVRQSALCDEVRFARDFLKVLRQEWELRVAAR
jgi:predicted O-linked N-acetylglucosamine transferase (SPINDLY family)